MAVNEKVEGVPFDYQNLPDWPKIQTQNKEGKQVLWVSEHLGTPEEIWIRNLFLALGITKLKCILLNRSGKETNHSGRVFHVDKSEIIATPIGISLFAVKVVVPDAVWVKRIRAKPLYRNPDGTWPETPDDVKVSEIRSNNEKTKFWKATYLDIKLESPAESLVFETANVFYLYSSDALKMGRENMFAWKAERFAGQVLEDFRNFISIGPPPYSQEEYDAAISELMKKISLYTTLTSKS